MGARFVNLHTHSHFSLLDGLARIDDLVQRAKGFGMPALALTDHGALYGAIEFIKRCMASGVTPIVGIETYLTQGGRMNRGSKEDDQRNHLILLAKNDRGYKNIMKLSTLAHLEGFYYRPRIDFELLERHHEGVIATSACINGPLGAAILEGRDPRPLLQRFLDIFGDDFYLELQHHPNIPDQQTVNTELIELSRSLHVRTIATLDSHYLTPDDAEAHDVLLCLQTKKEKSDQNRMCMLGEDFSFSDGSQLADAFSDIPECLENTLRIAQQCELSLTFGKTILPRFPLPEGREPDAELITLCEQGLARRYGDGVTHDIRARLSYELETIVTAGFSSYMLIVQDFVAWAKQQGIVVGPGRGSAAGSIVAYLLGITNVDPLQYGLYFERFLNPERISMPDIDLDFADARRDEVLAYAEQKYGKDHVAQIITFGTMAARVSIRDVGRVLGKPYSFCDALAKMIPAHMTLSQSIEAVPELKQYVASNQDTRDVITIAQKLEGVARHTSTHACAVVITPDSLTEYIPCQYASPDDKRVVTQYEMHAVEELGLLKIDFLGLSNLTILEHAKNIVARTRGIDIDYDHLVHDDKKTFQLLREARTTGVFQLESSGMKRYLKALGPTEMEDIIAMVALYRPGPMDLIPEYIAGKKGVKRPQYVHPILEPILSKTYGIAVYQEQVMQMARDCAGFTLGESDVLRKAVAKKIPSLLAEQKKKFIDGASVRGITRELAQKIFEFIEPFAGYGFNRSHATCYALIAYQTAYMKANYPAEFMAALLTADHGTMDRIAIEIEECRQMGLTVLPPDINESVKSFTVVYDQEGNAHTIRFGLLAIKNVGEQCVDTIVEEQKAHGAFDSLEDFLMRMPGGAINRKSLECLIRSGALDRFGDRNQMMYNCERLLGYHRALIGEAENRQASLFGNLSNVVVLSLDHTEPLDNATKLAWEKELLGLYLSAHPLHDIEPVMAPYVRSCTDVKTLADGESVRICGVVAQTKKVITKKSESMLFVRIEDLSDSLEIIVFPSVLRESIQHWSETAIVVIEGRVSRKDAEVKVVCSRVRSVDAELLEQLSAKKQTATVSATH